jgi:hypothetical protein
MDINIDEAFRKKDYSIFFLMDEMTCAPLSLPPD